MDYYLEIGESLELGEVVDYHFTLHENSSWEGVEIEIILDEIILNNICSNISK